MTVELGTVREGETISTRIRTAISQDLPTLLAFEQGIVSAERPFDETLRPDPISYYDIEELMASEDAEVVVAETDGRLIGSGYAVKKASRHYVTPPFHAYIGFLYVDPAYRGMGVNQKVLDALFEWASERGLFEVHLTVYPANTPAIRAYEKAGFDPYLLEMRVNLEGGNPGRAREATLS
ncbi:MAG: GNAT family N-acetyltransferase [Pseudomonadota bacterium]